MAEPTKKCPYCYTRVKTAVTKCDVCHKKIGPPDEFNMAKRPFNWFGYLTATITCGAFLYFLVWLFYLKDLKG